MASNGGLSQTMSCLQSLARTLPDSLAFEVVFVDNASRDGTSSALRGVEGDFVVLRNERDCGFAGALGQATQVARGEILIVVRGDVVAQSGWVQPLVAALDADPALDMVRPEVIAPAADLSAGACFAVRARYVRDVLAAGSSEAGEAELDRH